MQVELKSAKVLYLREFKMSTTNSMCPHVFKEYITRVNEVVDTYEPQIIAKVEFTNISECLQKYHVLKDKEISKINELQSNTQQMHALLEAIKKRVWGIENLIMTLIDKSIDAWLTEELFQSYVRHVVTNVKKTEQDSCICIETGPCKMHRAWASLLETCDHYLNEVGSSLGFLTLTIHPHASSLNFIAQKLKVPKMEKEILSDSDQDQKTYSGAERLLYSTEHRFTPNSSLQETTPSNKYATKSIQTSPRSSFGHASDDDDNNDNEEEDNDNNSVDLNWDDVDLNLTLMNEFQSVSLQHLQDGNVQLPTMPNAIENFENVHGSGSGDYFNNK